MTSPSERIRSFRDVVRSAHPDVSRIQIVVCGAPARISTLARASLRIAAFRPPPVAAPLAPVPYAVALMPLGDDLDMVLIGLPLVPAYAPLWPLALADANAIVRLDPACERLLDEACAVVGRTAFEVDGLVAGFSEEDEEHVASLLRHAAERAEYA